jgi:hypothetical protein
MGRHPGHPAACRAALNPEGRLFAAMDWGYAGAMRRFYLRRSAFLVRSILALCAWALVAASCGASHDVPSSGSGGIATGGIGMGGSGGTGGTSTTDAGEPSGSCLPGATQSDCQLCGPDLSSTCQRACPKVDCSVYPVPAGCAAVCSGATCCECQRSFGNEYFWRSPLLPIACGTACSGMVSTWTGYLADPGLTACTTATDCIVVGGPSYCDCGPSLGGCGRAVNAAAYRASPAATLESQFRSSCSQGFNACDCGPGFPDCVDGTCTVTRWGCCMCAPDAGRF